MSQLLLEVKNVISSSSNFHLWMHSQLLTNQTVHSGLWLGYSGGGGGGGELVLPDQKGHGKSCARRTFQSLINICFPKIVGGGGGGKFSFILINLSKNFLQLLLFHKLFNFFCWIAYFLPNESVVKIARQNCNINPPPRSYVPVYTDRMELI